MATKKPVTADAEQTQQPEAAELEVRFAYLDVRTRPGVARFCRAGYCFGPDPLRLRVADLADAEMTNIADEPMLVVEFVEETDAA